MSVDNDICVLRLRSAFCPHDGGSLHFGQTGGRAPSGGCRSVPVGGGGRWPLHTTLCNSEQSICSARVWSDLGRLQNHIVIEIDAIWSSCHMVLYGNGPRRKELGKT